MENTRFVVFRKLPPDKREVWPGQGLEAQLDGELAVEKLMGFDKVYAYGTQKANRKIKYNLFAPTSVGFRGILHAGLPPAGISKRA